MSPVPLPGPSSSRARRRTPLVLPLLTAGALMLGACAPQAAGTTANAPSAEQAVPAQTAPVTLDNCGTTLTLTTPPERIVAVKSSVAELALALGAGDRLVGVAYLDGPFPEEVAAQGDTVPVLSEKVPGAEAVLATEPDLVWAGWESVFSGDSAGERDTFAAAGVATYVAPSACKEPGYQPERLTTEVLLAEITEAGRVLGEDEAAAAIVAEQQLLASTTLPAAREGLPSDVPGGADGTVSALWYSSGTDTPYVGAGIGAPQLVMDLVGLTNIAGDVPDTWTPFAWEQVVAEDPDVLVLVDATWNSAEKKIALLESDPVLSTLTAVKNSRYLVVPFAATEAGLRTLPAALDLVEQLRTVLTGVTEP